MGVSRKKKRQKMRTHKLKKRRKKLRNIRKKK